MCVCARTHGEIRCKQGWKNVGKVIDECYISGVYANTATSRAPIAGIIQRGRLLPAGAIFPREQSPRSQDLSLSLLARENAHLLTFYNSMLIKSSNIVLRATIINHASSSRAHVRSALSPPIFQDYRIRNHCPIVPRVFLS